VQTLVGRGLLAVRPGIGTVVADGSEATPAEKRALLGGEVERLVVEARRLGLSIDDVVAAIEREWKRIDGRR
jgi:GntR family transcriptional regulator